MNELDFVQWMRANNVNRKVSRDLVSRLKKIEKEFSIEIEAEYRKDGCEELMTLFLKKNGELLLKKYPLSNFPIGKYYITTYRHAIKKYIGFLESAHVSKSINS